MRVAVLGDSLSAGYSDGTTYVEDFGRSYAASVARSLRATNLAIVATAGARVRHVADGIERLPFGVDVLIVNAGTNDMWEAGEGTVSVESVTGAWDAMMSSIRARAQPKRIIVIGLRDVTKQRLWPDGPFLHESIVTFNRHILCDANAITIGLADRDGAYDDERFPDAIHPSQQGVDWLARAVVEGWSKA